jgi:hypothetical protein
VQLLRKRQISGCDAHFVIAGMAQQFRIPFGLLNRWLAIELRSVKNDGEAYRGRSAQPKRKICQNGDFVLGVLKQLRGGILPIGIHTVRPFGLVAKYEGMGCASNCLAVVCAQIVEPCLP